MNTTMNFNSKSETKNGNFDPSHHNFSYKDLSVWQISIQFASDVLDFSEKMRNERKNYRLAEQLEAAVTSIPMNIAEGKGRISKKEFCHFLMIARGSLYETLTLLEIFKFRSWISIDEYNKFEYQAKEITIKINALYKSISKNI